MEIISLHNSLITCRKFSNVGHFKCSPNDVFISSCDVAGKISLIKSFLFAMVQFVNASHFV